MSNLRRDAHWLLSSESQFRVGNCVSLRFDNGPHRDGPACIATDVTAPVEACRPHFASGLIIGDAPLDVRFGSRNKRLLSDLRVVESSPRSVRSADSPGVFHAISFSGPQRMKSPN